MSEEQRTVVLSPETNTRLRQLIELKRAENEALRETINVLRARLAMLLDVVRDELGEKAFLLWEAKSNGERIEVKRKPVKASRG